MKKTYYIEGSGSVVLGDDNFVRAGGEGAVYHDGSGVGFKVYHDGCKPVPERKIRELAALHKNPDIIIPQNRLYEDRGRRLHCGHSFRFVDNTWVLTSIFPRSFRNRQGVEDTHIHKIVMSLRGGIEDLHREKILGVDLNEMNFLVPRSLDKTFFIDTDSYQTPSFPATAIMDSIRDPLAKKWTTGSDWFSFAVLAFQLFIGIHPYKGKHPAGAMKFQERMKRGLSVFDAGVTLPPPCYAFSTIPAAFHDWFKAVFVEGKREAPPTSMAPSMMIPTNPVQTKKVQGKVRMSTYVTIGEPIRDVLHIESSSRHVLLGASHLWVDGRKFMKTPRGVSSFAVHASDGKRLLCWAQDEVLQVRNLDDNAPVVVNTAALDVLSTNGRVYFRTDRKMFELRSLIARGRVLAQGSFLSHLLPRASSFHHGAVLQDLRGTPHVTIYPQPGHQVQCRLKDLAGHHVLDVKYEGGMLGIVSSDPDGDLYRHIMKIGTSGVEHTRRVPVSTASLLNFTVIEKTGIMVLLDEEGDLEILSTKRPDKVQVIPKDPNVVASMARLSSTHANLLGVSGPSVSLWQMG